MYDNMAGSRLGQWLCLVVCILILLKAEGASIPITIVESAVSSGALCLDGSPPGYHFEKGSGSGIDNWEEDGVRMSSPVFLVGTLSGALP